MVITILLIGADITPAATADLQDAIVAHFPDVFWIIVWFLSRIDIGGEISKRRISEQVDGFRWADRFRVVCLDRNGRETKGENGHREAVDRSAKDWFMHHIERLWPRFEERKGEMGGAMSADSGRGSCVHRFDGSIGGTRRLFSLKFAALFPLLWGILLAE